MARYIAHLLGTIAILLVALLWLSLLNPPLADRLVDRLLGPEKEYALVLGTGLLASVLAFIAALHGTRWWYAGVALSLGTLGFFVFALSR